eukprot:gnl/MRDRNA2_/MRDRNA2_32194_c0_seq1.p1 gnl/MRDRNA2_/MRDRNA2_32194_c0~~gnl/MRDRNA2_/MRDRNA2_32194_c0_seq1.p1  ORF type:complete len:665 (+),score=114.32 gnl/MRDRNA2_/MRDRNA2_32194_c0_seq1:54-2048(+)
MMRIISVTLLNAFVAIADVQESKAHQSGDFHDSAKSMEEVGGNMVDNLFGRARTTVQGGFSHLQDIALRKPGSLLTPGKPSLLEHLSSTNLGSSKPFPPQRQSSRRYSSPILRRQSFHHSTSWAHHSSEFSQQALPAHNTPKSRSAVIAETSSVAGEEGLKTTQEESVPLALLLYPDEGKPGFGETEHLGNTMNWGDEQFSAEWPQAAAQLLQRVRWDLGNPPSAAIRALSLKEFCSELSQGVLPNFKLVLGIDLPARLPANCEASAMQALGDCPQRLFISSTAERDVPEFWDDLTLLGGATSYSMYDSKVPIYSNLLAVIKGFDLESARLGNNVADLVHRRTAEETVYAILLLIDGAMQPLSAMQAQKPVPTNDGVRKAVDKCQDEFKACFTEPRCLQTLFCISNCGLADQSCSYNCITSYQNEAFQQFSLCALQQNNLLNSQIVRPTTPAVAVMETFRGAPLSTEVADDILVGHYNPAAGTKYSWLAAAGSNPAYEQFSWQYQLWYRGEKKDSFWYHPTFQVNALDGRQLWRTRDYRVRRTKMPGIWEFSVLDNGIMSEEKWHLLGADENLQWCVLFYIGAARKAGLSYRGCLVMTRDGKMPEGASAAQGIYAALSRVGLKPWELEATVNPPLNPSDMPPLIAPESQPPAPLLQSTPVSMSS